MRITRKETYKLIWNQMQNSKFKEFYISLLLEKYQKKERNLNIFLVIVTSSSISAWAIWEIGVLKWIWAVIIASSQIISLIKPYLNHSKYIKELNEKYFLLQTLNLDYDKLWHNFKFERITEEEAFEKSLDLKDMLTKGLNFSDDIILSENKEFNKKAKIKLANYLRVYYQIE